MSKLDDMSVEEVSGEIIRVRIVLKYLEDEVIKLQHDHKELLEKWRLETGKMRFGDEENEEYNENNR